MLRRPEGGVVRCGEWKETRIYQPYRLIVIPAIYSLWRERPHVRSVDARR